MTFLVNKYFSCLSVISSHFSPVLIITPRTWFPPRTCNTWEPLRSRCFLCSEGSNTWSNRSFCDSPTCEKRFRYVFYTWSKRSFSNSPTCEERFHYVFYGRTLGLSHNSVTVQPAKKGSVTFSMQVGVEHLVQVIIWHAIVLP